MKLLSFFTKLLHYLPSEFAHTLALNSLKIAYITGFLKLLSLHKNRSNDIQSTFTEEKDIFRNYDNRIGFAAGLDKNGDYIDCLASLGVGFIEIGTITPKPQPGNTKPRLFRDKKNLALVNRMGFNNKGIHHLVKKLENRKSIVPLGISIGKNFDTPNEEAYKDYLICLDAVYPFADYIAVNISSPNTRNLRDLSKKENLEFLIKKIKNRQIELSINTRYKPIFLKLSPDESEEQLISICNSIKDLNVDGVICTNTSIQLDNKYGGGGVSGKPLAEVSSKLIRTVRNYAGDDLPIIASGGVMNKDDYQEKLESGADLVQIYTGFIYAGPSLISDILKI